MELVLHALFSSFSGLSVALTGFDCSPIREVFSVLSRTPDAFAAPSPINIALSAALVTAVQVENMSVYLVMRVVSGSLG